MRRPKRKLAGRSSSFHVVCCSWNRRVGGSCRGSSSAEDGVYIEVKSTSSASRELFEVSPAEIDFMRRAGPAYMYEIHRVWDAGSRDVRLARLQHPAAHLAAGKLTLLMSFGGASVPPALHASSDSCLALTANWSLGDLPGPNRAAPLRSSAEPWSQRFALGCVSRFGEVGFITPNHQLNTIIMSLYNVFLIIYQDNYV